jgi:hypothetical protein
MQSFVFGKVQPGNLDYLYSKTGSCATTLVLSELIRLAECGMRSVYISSDMPRAVVFDRLLAVQNDRAVLDRIEILCDEKDAQGAWQSPTYREIEEAVLRNDFFVFDSFFSLNDLKVDDFVSRITKEKGKSGIVARKVRSSPIQNNGGATASRSYGGTHQSDRVFYLYSYLDKYKTKNKKQRAVLEKQFGLKLVKNRYGWINNELELVREGLCMVKKPSDWLPFG